MRENTEIEASEGDALGTVDGEAGAGDPAGAGRAQEGDGGGEGTSVRIASHQ